MIKYARKCDITGKGINSGWVWGEGEFYTSTEEHTIEELKKSYPDNPEYWNLQYAYNNYALYWTKWDDSNIIDQGYYYTDNGIEIQYDSLESFNEQFHTLKTSILQEIRRIFPKDKVIDFYDINGEDCSIEYSIEDNDLFIYCEGYECGIHQMTLEDLITIYEEVLNNV